MQLNGRLTAPLWAMYVKAVLVLTLAADEEERVLVGAATGWAVEWWLFVSGTTGAAAATAEFVT